MMFLLLILAVVFCDISKCKNNDAMRSAFSQFQMKFNKAYNDDEAEVRYYTFCENVNFVLDFQKQYPDNSDWMGITPFMDMTPAEFRIAKLSTKKYTPEELREGRQSVEWVPSNNGTLPDNFDWNDKGAVTPVKNQESCGSCWTFSATGSMEGQWFLKKGELLEFSEQQIVDCDTTSAGCNGGLMDNAFKYIIGAGGIETEDEYPYEGVTGTCRADKSKFKAQFSNYVDIAHDEGVMQQWCYENGPISIALDAELLQFYFGGIFNPPSFLCPKSALDHGILITGWGQEKGTFVDVKKYWIVKNSWGESWGEKGYFKLHRGDCKCGVCESGCSALV